MLGNLKKINLLLSCLCKKRFCHDNGHRHAKICKYRLGDMTTNYHIIRSKFSRTAKVVQRSIFYVDLSWINFSQRASHCNRLGSVWEGIPFSCFSYMRGLGFHWVKYKKGMGNLSFWSVKNPKRANRHILWPWERQENFLVWLHIGVKKTVQLQQLKEMRVF